MPIHEVESDHLKKIEETTFSTAGVRERKDLQRLLRKQIEIIAPDVLIIAEEFGAWDDSRRRVDLLGIDKDANLVVIELKRTEDGGHMELQALRYAAMVSTMTFEETISVYRDYLQSLSDEKDPQHEILEFLGWGEPDEDRFAQDVRIVLASAEFSKEITSSVLWLNTYGIDIRCVRMKPYNDGGRTLIDVEQVIPLPEASEYQIQVSTKSRQERKSRTSTRDFTKFDVAIYGVLQTNLAKRNAMFYIAKNLSDHGAKPEKIAELIHWRSNRTFFEVEGECNSGEFIKRANQKLEASGRTFDERRWFCDEGELIIQNGKTYAFSNQWGFRWMEAVKILKKNFLKQTLNVRLAFKTYNLR